MHLTATFSRPDRADRARRWQALEARSDASFFLGWTWVGAWLDTYAVAPDLLAVTDGEGADVALALVGHAMQPRLLGPVATLSLNQSGERIADRPYVEYNGLLTETGRQVEAAAAAIAALTGRRDWRALRLSGSAPGSALLDEPARRRICIDVSPVYQVDLAAVRGAPSPGIERCPAASGPRRVRWRGKPRNAAGCACTRWHPGPSGPGCRRACRRARLRPAAGAVPDAIAPEDALFIRLPISFPPAKDIRPAFSPSPRSPV